MKGKIKSNKQKAIWRKQKIQRIEENLEILSSEK